MAKKDKKKWNPIALEILEDSIKFCLQDKPEWPYLKELNQLLTTNPRDYDQESRIHELLISLGINFDKLRERVALRYAKFNGIKIIDE